MWNTAGVSGAASPVIGVLDEAAIGMFLRRQYRTDPAIHACGLSTKSRPYDAGTI